MNDEPMFNLLITAFEGAWDKSVFEYDVSRFLTHTDDDIKKRLLPLDYFSTTELCQLPTLFAYENACEMPARVGFITDIRVRSHNVRFTFKFDPTFTPISAQAVADLQMELDIRGFELNNSHWAVKRVDLREVLRAAGFMSGVDITPLEVLADETDLEGLIGIVRQSIEKDQPVEALDRLHTLTTKYLRARLQQRGVAIDKSKALHSIFGEYVRSLHDAQHIQSKMAGSILKSMHGPLEAFNQVRNDHSLAHDNVALLNHDEALFIFSHVTHCLRFLRKVEEQIDVAIAGLS